MWTNLTMTIHDLKFKVEYDYTDLNNSIFNSYERHIIWRYENLGIGEEQVSKEEKEILKRYQIMPKTLSRKEHYDAGIYIKDVENMIAYSTGNDKTESEVENEEIKEEKIQPVEVKETEVKHKNQLLLSQEEMKKMNKN